MDERIYWIWLSLACTPDTSTFKNLLLSFNSPKDIYDADIKEISKAIGHKTSDRSNLNDKSLERAEKIFNFCNKYKVGILAYGDEKYPKSLRDIDTPPVLLYYRGILPDFNNRFFVSAVGTRMLSDYGRRSSFRISYDLALAGATIVSGMAMGIDGVALAGAISAGGATVAVLGSGINVCYPKGHNKLAREIVKRGCILTEYPPDTKPLKYNFPKRNRIISGLSQATLVFEGTEQSGSLITARYAMNQGRALYALPGSVGEKNSEVCNLLLKNGARICTSAEDILNDFSDMYPATLNPFNLPVKAPVNMMEILRQLEVIALCQGDDVFLPPLHKNRIKDKNKSDKTDNPEYNSKKDEPSFDKLDAKAVRLYKKIPPSEQCSLESLVDEEMNLREVMKYLLKLEVGGFIEMLPGEMIARKIK